jgi:hypothetical protein
MRIGISINVSSSGRRRLAALVRDRNAAQKHVWRAEIVLLSVDGVSTNEIMRRTGKSKTCVWRWQERFAEEGFEGLLRDKTRPSRIPPLGAEVVDRVVTLTLSDPPGGRGARLPLRIALVPARPRGSDLSPGDDAVASAAPGPPKDVASRAVVWPLALWCGEDGGPLRPENAPESVFLVIGHSPSRVF